MYLHASRDAAVTTKIVKRNGELLLQIDDKIAKERIEARPDDNVTIDGLTMPATMVATLAGMGANGDWAQCELAIQFIIAGD